MVKKKTRTSMATEESQNFLNDYKYALGVGLGTLVIVIVLASTLGKGFYGELNKSSNELNSKRQVKAKLEENLANLKELKKNEDKIIADSKKVTSALPSHKDVSRLFVEFENIAATNGLYISNVSEQKSNIATNNAAGVESLEYRVSAEASDYQSLKNALTSLSSALRILSVSAVDISPSSDKLNVNLTVSTYVRPE